MKRSLSIAIAVGLLGSAAAPLHAQVRITEVAPWGSGASNTPYRADWFEITNVGTAAVNLSGWTMDDDSNNPNSALLSGVTSLAAGESAIFLELSAGASPSDLRTSFLNSWFGASVPAGLQVGTYTQGVAGGVGLSTDGDAVNLFSGVAGALQARVSFGSSTTATPFRSFDNSAGANNAPIALLSETGVSGAFQALNNVNNNVQIGSPGVIAAIPEPQTYALMALGLALVGVATRRRSLRA